MVKKTISRSKKAKHVSVSATHVLIKRGIVSYAVLVFIFFATISMSIYLIDRIVAVRAQQIRYDRISSIYDSLKLDNSYRVVTSNVFGDKRVYEWDKGRSFSSSVEYGHNDTVGNTFADLTKKIEARGFKKFDTPYAGSIAQQYHFKNNANEYIRVSVVSKVSHDMEIYGTPSLDDWLAIPNEQKYAAPSYVTIKVNLDDNNE